MSRSTEMRNPEICWRNRSGCAWLGCGRNKRTHAEGPWRNGPCPLEIGRGRQWQALSSEWCSTSLPSLMSLEGEWGIFGQNTCGLGSTMLTAGCWITWVTHKSLAQEPVFLTKPWGTCLIRSHHRRAQTKHWTPSLFSLCTEMKRHT